VKTPFIGVLFFLLINNKSNMQIQKEQRADLEKQRANNAEQEIFKLKKKLSQM
jgi:hypothetical protein